MHTTDYYIWNFIWDGGESTVQAVVIGCDQELDVIAIDNTAS